MLVKFTAITVGIAVAVLVISVPCHAVKITNITTGEVLFEDDFEDDMPGAQPAPGIMGPPPPAGWFTGGGYSTVEDANTQPSPGPIQGANYLWVRDSSNLRVDFASPQVGDHVHAEWMYWIPNTAQVYDTASPFYFGANDTDGGQTVFYSPDEKCNGSVWCPGGHTNFANEEWQKWELDHVVGSSTFAITINGQEKAGLNAQFGSNGIWDNIEFVKRSKQPEIHNYVDAVPADWVNPDPVPPANTFQWNGGVLGDWGQTANWAVVDGSPPEGPRANDPNHTVIFPDSTTAPINVSTMDAVTVNRIEFNNSTQSVVVSGLGSVNLAFDSEDDFGPPSLSVTGSHKFQAAVNLQNATTVDVTSNSQLVFDGALDLGENTLTKTGAGELAIRNDLVVSGGGSISVQQGTVSGNGTVGGDLNNDSGTVSPGNSPGVITVEGDFSQGEQGTLHMELAGTKAGRQYDQFIVAGEASLAGTLEVSLLDGFEPQAGDNFDILKFSLTRGDFDNVILPALTGSLSWDTTGLTSAGSLGVVPEPVSCTLLAMGMLAAVGYSRRRSRTFQLAA